MRPETWLPTWTVTRAESVPLAVTRAEGQKVLDAVDGAWPDQVTHLVRMFTGAGQGIESDPLLPRRHAGVGQEHDRRLQAIWPAAALSSSAFSARRMLDRPCHNPSHVLGNQYADVHAFLVEALVPPTARVRREYGS